MSALSEIKDAIRAYLGSELVRQALYRAVVGRRALAMAAGENDLLGWLFWRTLSLLDERGYGHRTDDELEGALRGLLAAAKSRQPSGVPGSPASAA